MMRHFFCLLLIMSSYYSLSAQLFRPRSDTSALTWKIRFVTDIGLQVLSKTEHTFYSGEKIFLQNGDTYWKWQTSDTTIKGPNALEKLTSLRLGVMLNIVGNLDVGFSYTPLLMRRYKTYYDDQGRPIWTNLETIPLFSLGGTVAYDYAMPFYKRLSLQPSVTVGGYQSNPEYEGVGSEWFYEGRLGLAFRPFKYNQLRVWCAYQSYLYRENSPSYIYDKNRTVKTDVNAFAWGLGYSFNIHIKEDAPRKVREKRKSKQSKD